MYQPRIYKFLMVVTLGGPRAQQQIHQGINYSPVLRFTRWTIILPFSSSLITDGITVLWYSFTLTQVLIRNLPTVSTLGGPRVHQLIHYSSVLFNHLQVIFNRRMIIQQFQ